MADKYTIPKEKVKQLEDLLQSRDLDAYLIFVRESSDCILPFLIGDDAIHLAAAFFTKSGKHIMLTSKSDEKKFYQSGIFSEVLTYDKSINEKFCQVLDEINPNKLVINFSENDTISDGLTQGLYMTLADMIGQERLSKLEVSSEEIVRELRAVKSPAEIEILHTAIQMTCDIYDEVFTKVHVGMTEKEIGDLFVDGMKSRGVCNGLGKPYDYPICCLVRCGLSHRGPGDNKSQPGDILVMDFSIKYKDYISDVSRTAYFLKEGETECDPEVKRAFDTANRAIDKAIETIGIGVRGHEVDAAARQVIVDAGYPTVRHSVGHSIGRECHDTGTNLSPYRGDDKAACCRPIGPNEIYALEPTVLQDDGLPCIIVEDDVLVTESGDIQVLSRRQRDIKLFPFE